MSIPARKAASASPAPSSGRSERAEVEAMAHRLEELRQAAGNGELRAAYRAAVEGLDGVLYRLAMLRTPGPAVARAPLATAAPRPTPAPKSSAAPRAAAARIGAARKPPR